MHKLGANYCFNDVLPIHLLHRACFKVLPRIMCFNTMRYTFNMVTMMKEKVNTHFSFPLQLNMAPYSEEYLMGEKKDQGELHKASWIFKVTNVLVVALNIVVSFAAITFQVSRCLFSFVIFLVRFEVQDRFHTIVHKKYEFG